MEQIWKSEEEFGLHIAELQWNQTMRIKFFLCYPVDYLLKKQSEQLQVIWRTYIFIACENYGMNKFGASAYSLIGSHACHDLNTFPNPTHASHRVDNSNWLPEIHIPHQCPCGATVYQWFSTKDGTSSLKVLKMWGGVFAFPNGYWHAIAFSEWETGFLNVKIQEPIFFT